MPTLIKKKKKKKKKKKYLSVNSNLPTISSHVSHPDSPSPIFPGHPIKPALLFSASHFHPHLILHIFLIHENFNQSKRRKENLVDTDDAEAFLEISDLFCVYHTRYQF